MRVVHGSKGLGLAALIAAGTIAFAGCAHDDGPFEETGDAIEESAEEVEDEADDLT